MTGRGAVRLGRGLGLQELQHQPILRAQKPRCGPEGFCVNGHERTPGDVGTNGYCRVCKRDVARERYATPQGKRERAYSKRKSRYGVTPEQYDAWVLEAAGYCPLCGGQDNDTRDTGLVVDHAHPPREGRKKKGHARGLICGGCNRLLHSVEFRGLDHDWLDAARRYLDRDNGSREEPTR
jgi:hypothetical protein